MQSSSALTATLPLRRTRTSAPAGEDLIPADKDFALRRTRTLHSGGQGAWPHFARALGLPASPEDAGEFDLVVVGGGYAGVATAVSAAGQSLNVGSGGKSPSCSGATAAVKFRLGPGGHAPRQISTPGRKSRNSPTTRADSPAAAKEFVDERKEQVVRGEPYFPLLPGAASPLRPRRRDGKMTSVQALEDPARRREHSVMRRCLRLHGAGGSARWPARNATWSPRGIWACRTCGIGSRRQSRSLAERRGHWRWKSAIFRGRPKAIGDRRPAFHEKGEWFWESGFNKHAINELELVRDWRPAGRLRHLHRPQARRRKKTSMLMRP